MIAYRHTDTGHLRCAECDKEQLTRSIGPRPFYYDARKVEPQHGDFCVDCCAQFIR